MTLARSLSVRDDHRGPSRSRSFRSSCGMSSSRSFHVLDIPAGCGSHLRAPPSVGNIRSSDACNLLWRVACHNVDVWGYTFSTLAL